MVTESKGLSSTQLRTLFDLPEATLTGVFMLLGVHLNIVLRETERTMLSKESAVPPFQDVQVRVAELRVLIDVIGTIPVANVLGHDRSPMRRILAMQNQSRPGLGTGE